MDWMGGWTLRVTNIAVRVLCWDNLKRFGEGFGASWGFLGGFGASFFHACIWSGLQSAFGGIWAGCWLDFKGFGKDFGRVLGGLGRDFRAFWAILVYYRLFSMTGLFWADFRKIFAGAPCCLLLLS